MFCPNKLPNSEPKFLLLNILSTAIVAVSGIVNSFFAGTLKRSVDIFPTLLLFTKIETSSVFSSPPILLGFKKWALAVSITVFELDSSTRISLIFTKVGFSFIEQLHSIPSIVNNIANRFSFIFKNSSIFTRYKLIFVGKDTILIREIQPDDNVALEAIIRNCFHEFNIPLTGTAFEDPETASMFESYQNENEVYYVVEHNGVVFGGGGIKPLKETDGTICELQKMYFSPKIRGQGIGKDLFSKCLEAAKHLGYKTCYLESAPQLKAAIYIYEYFGFKHLTTALGNTGHFSCGIWMLKDL